VDEPTLAELFNIPVPDAYEFEGRKYPARQPDQIEQGLFAAWLAAEAFAAVERQTHLPAAALERHRRGVREDVTAGRYGYYSPAGIGRLGTISGAAKIMSICLLADGFGECDHDFCQRMLLAEAERSATRLMELAAAGDPKAKAALDLFRSLMSPPSGTSGSSATTSTASSSPTAATTPPSGG
jgi:hypothetical protein